MVKEEKGERPVCEKCKGGMFRYTNNDGKYWRCVYCENMVEQKG